MVRNVSDQLVKANRQLVDAEAAEGQGPTVDVPMRMRECQSRKSNLSADTAPVIQETKVVGDSATHELPKNSCEIANGESRLDYYNTTGKCTRDEYA